MKDKIYIPVKCSDRYPSKEGDYYTNAGRSHFYVDGQDWDFTPTFWFEEISLPTEEEIIAILNAKVEFSLDPEYKGVYIDNIVNTAKAILNLLKQEK